MSARLRCFLLVGLALWLLAGPVIAASQAPPQTRPSGEGKTTVLYFVRHAEKQLPRSGEALPDPRLTDSGRERAARLADLLAAEKIDSIFSSDYRRTRETAGPLAARLGLEVEIYDPGRLGEMAAKLRGLRGRHVIVGHSNTTPALVELLGGQPGDPIDEAGEYDRLYVLVLGEAGTTTLALRYGAPSKRE